MTLIDIPEHWAAEDALRLATFLEDIVRAIWNVHGDAIGRFLEAHYEALDAQFDARPIDQEDTDWPF